MQTCEGPLERDAPLLHELFYLQAQRSPHKVAVVDEDGEVTYDILASKADAIAQRLSEAHSSEIVAVCLPRSAQLIAGLVGVLKHGSAYLPIEQDTPRTRIQTVLTTAGARTVLTTADMAPMFEELGMRTVIAGSDQPSLAAPTGQRGVDTDLAYVMFTSGSSGVPKGVEIEHRNVTHLLRSTDRVFDFSDADVWTLFHSIAFDFSVWEMWKPLTTGGRVVIIPASMARDPERFFSSIQEYSVTVLNQTPTAFRALVNTCGSAAFRSLALRYVIFGGEALSLDLIKPLRNRSKTIFVNMLGTTEATVHSTYHVITASDGDAGYAPIGKPLPGLSCLPYGDDGLPAAVGVPGELYIEGATVGRGYIGRPELTAERFAVANGTRTYRSGDYVVQSGDGILQYIGRRDDQVKVRGHRIELAEVEAALQSHPDVIGCAVTVVSDTEPVTQYLLAHVVTRPAHIPSSEGLRTYLMQLLPAYMVPSRYAWLERLPLNESGKLARHELPSHEAVSLEDALTTQIDKLARELLSIACEILSVEDLGLDDNIFSAGMASVQLLRFRANAREEIGADFSLLQVISNPTIRELAGAIAAQRSGDGYP